MRRMLVPEIKIKSKIVDDASSINLTELEPYVENGLVIVQAIISEPPNDTSHIKKNLLVLQDDIEGLTYNIVNGAIITFKISADEIRAYSYFYDNDDDGLPYDLLYFNNYNLGDLTIRCGIMATIDLYIIKN